MNNTFFRYLYHRIKSTWLSYAVIAVLFFLIGTLSIETYYSYYNRGEDLHIHFSGSMLAVLFMVFCIYEAISQFSMFKNRRNLDLWYQLPISRRELYGVHFTTGILEMCVALLMALFGILVKTIGFTDNIDMQYLPAFFGRIFLFGILLFGQSCFIYDRANSRRDGSTFVVIYIFLAYFVIMSIGTASLRIENAEEGPDYQEVEELGETSKQFVATYPYIVSESEIDDLINYEDHNDDYYDEEYGESVGVGYVFNVVVQCIMTLLFFVMAPMKSSDKIGDVSDSWFGYKVLIPVLTMAGMLALPLFYSCAFFLLGALACFFVYRKSVKLKKQDWFTMLGLLCFAIIVCLIFADVSW